MRMPPPLEEAIMGQGRAHLSGKQPRPSQTTHVGCLDILKLIKISSPWHDVLVGTSSFHPPNTQILNR